MGFKPAGAVPRRRCYYWLPCAPTGAERQVAELNKMASMVR
jgi:hypothetical protein